MRFFRSVPRHLCERRIPPRVNSLTPVPAEESYGKVERVRLVCLCPPSNYSAWVTGQTDGLLAPRRNFCRTVPSWGEEVICISYHEKRFPIAIRDRAKLAWRNFAWSETPLGNYSLVSRAKWGFFVHYVSTIGPHCVCIATQTRHDVRTNFNAFFFYIFLLEIDGSLHRNALVVFFKGGFICFFFFLMP